ncbi:MAG: hypothetical protein IAA89_00285 [Firmicutes bacterium]|uniref:Uncharacterized protein n=1 Tax=Candidatus Gallilactobacillus intestinavium TaxID=2840838 RepID=A0A9D9H4L1_9LACO|nr:hypothetical protein [Candidatus Gallilactobacillus intestinavium]
MSEETPSRVNREQQKRNNNQHRNRLIIIWILIILFIGFVIHHVHAEHVQQRQAEIVQKQSQKDHSSLNYQVQNNPIKFWNNKLTKAQKIAIIIQSYYNQDQPKSLLRIHWALQGNLSDGGRIITSQKNTYSNNLTVELTDSNKIIVTGETRTNKMSINDAMQNFYATSSERSFTNKLAKKIVSVNKLEKIKYGNDDSSSDDNDYSSNKNDKYNNSNNSKNYYNYYHQNQTGGPVNPNINHSNVVSNATNTTMNNGGMNTQQPMQNH